MIERVYIKKYLSFDEVEIEFSKGLNVFTGRSGAGKSILMKGILAIFGFEEAKANLSEAIINYKMNLEEYGLEGDEELIFRQIKKNKNRYFINNQAISKKNLIKISKNFIDYLSLRDIDELKNENILAVLDKIIQEREYYVKLKKFKKKYKKLKKIKEKISEIEKNEKESLEKKEFLKYEIEKINSIAPKEGEFEELMRIKKELSKIEKIKEKIKEIEGIFYFEDKVYEFLNLIEENSEFFSTAMNELRIIIEKSLEKVEELNNLDIEEILNRLSILQGLIKRFNSIENALNYVKEKEEELKFLENLSFEKEHLKKEEQLLEKELINLGEYIHQKRVTASKRFIDKLNYFLNKLYMKEAKIVINKTALNPLGISKAEIIIDGIDINTISTGELNRLRVGLLAAKLEYFDEKKTLFLDEIDANLSGEESMSVAEVLKYLSSKYQIIAISHQPQLSSVADKHFAIIKENDKSFVKNLDLNERIEEISRIIGGKEKSKKAVEYAKELLKINKVNND